MKTYSQLILELLEATATKRKPFDANDYKAKVAAFKWSKPKPLKMGYKGEYLITSEDGRLVIIRQFTYGGEVTFRMFAKKDPNNTWNNLPSLADAKSQAMDYI